MPKNMINLPKHIIKVIENENLKNYNLLFVNESQSSNSTYYYIKAPKVTKTEIFFDKDDVYIKNGKKFVRKHTVKETKTRMYVVRDSDHATYWTSDLTAISELDVNKKIEKGTLFYEERYGRLGKVIYSSRFMTKVKFDNEVKTYSTEYALRRVD